MRFLSTSGIDYADIANVSAGFRRFRITRKVPESAIITSFYLAPCDGKIIWAAAPGQYLTLRVPGARNSLLKTYSISTDVANLEETRITVKREAAPAHSPELPPGQGSSWLHDVATVGTEIEIAAPRGKFMLDQSSQRPVVLLSGGVGQTPLLSMLHRLAHSERKVWYLHACENGGVHAMHDEVTSLVKEAGGRVQHHVCYRSPSENDHSAQRFQSHGVINKALLQSLLPIDDYECYLCGPTPFMVAMYRLLISIGVPETRIAYEFFGKAKSLPVLADQEAALDLQLASADRIDPSAVGSRALAKAPAALAKLAYLIDPDARATSEDSVAPTDHNARPAPAHESVAVRGDTKLTIEKEVIFARSGVSAKWPGTDVSLLELAENAGLSPDFSCRSGICNTCVCRIREGNVDYFVEPLQPPEPGTVLICCSRPRGRVVLEL